MMSQEERASVRESVHWGCRWLRALDRAVELQLAGAIAECTFILCDLFASLSRHIDFHGEINRIAPHARAGMQRAEQSQKGAMKGNAEKNRISKNCEGVIARLYKKFSADGCGYASCVEKIQKEVPKRRKSFIERVIRDLRKK